MTTEAYGGSVVLVPRYTGLLNMNAIYIGEDMVVQLSGLYDVVAKTYQNSATVKYTLQTALGVNITGGNNIAMSYVTASNGDYRGYIESTVTGLLTENSFYHLLIHGAVDVYRRVVCRAVYRGTV